jgi:3',5'-cyclic AMP phosphodiesterase CpdA
MKFTGEPGKFRTASEDPPAFPVQEIAMLTLAQITDLHITSDKDRENKDRNERRLRMVLRAIHALKPRPHAIIASGDLVDRGEPEEYDELLKILADVEIPLYLGIGNHDRRASFRAAFPATPSDANGFIQYAVDFGAIRMVMLDTLDEGRDDGAFCKRRATSAKHLLNQGRRTPTIVVFHHPPIPSGIRWMDPDPDSEWILRLQKTLKGHKQILTGISGHVHRSYFGSFAGHPLSVGPATSIQLALDLTEVDMRMPDGREILVDEPPGYTLLVWNNGQLITHFCVAGEFESAVTYDVPFITG